MYRPDSNSPNHCRTILWVELATVYQLCRLWESVWQCGQRYPLKLLRHYGVPNKLVNLIRNSYDGMCCKVMHEGQFTGQFEVKTGVRQGCLLSPLLFLLVIDWIMKATTEQGRNGIQWTLWKQLDDLDFADDVALPFQTRNHAYCKNTGVKVTRVLWEVHIP